MNKSAPQTGETVDGYRTLGDGQIQQMNTLKQASRHFLSLIDTAVSSGADPRWAAMAKSHMQHSCMFACRAVTKPDDDC